MKQKFLTEREFNELFHAETPRGVYAEDLADDPDFSKRSVSSSEYRSYAKQLAIASDNLSDIYADKFLSTVTASGIALWEADYFASAQDASQALETRRQNLISKIRSTAGISLPAMRSIVAGILGSVDFDLLPYSGQAGVGAWILSRSKIDQGTWLREIDPIIGARRDPGITPLGCSRDYAAAGITESEMHAIERVAYTFEVRIYATVSDSTLKTLDTRLTQFEPAWVTHIIRNGQTRFVLDYAAYKAATPEYDRLRI